MLKTMYLNQTHSSHSHADYVFEQDRWMVSLGKSQLRTSDVDVGTAVSAELQYAGPLWL